MNERSISDDASADGETDQFSPTLSHEEMISRVILFCRSFP